MIVFKLIWFDEISVYVVVVFLFKKKWIIVFFSLSPPPHSFHSCLVGSFISFEFQVYLEINIIIISLEFD